ncbi:MAG TPA: ferritin [Candidatus Sumerlaeota bacterium]|nr:ferritin [Candidatus Sumerlaeota bacterium]
MISKKMLNAINQQINAEMYSGYLYLSMSAWCSDQNLDGFAKWFRIQYGEEWEHAMKMYDYINEQQGKVALKAIDAPPVEFKSIKEIADMQLEHEKKVTGLIRNLVTLAREEKDYATEIFLQWFIKEQVEEEAKADQIIKKLEMIGSAKHLIYMLDKEMGKRAAD